MARIIRPDDQLRIRLGGRRGQAPARVRGLGGLVRTSGSSLRSACVMVKYISSTRAHSFAEYMQRSKAPEESYGEHYAQYMQHDRAQLFTADGHVCDQAAFVARSHGDPRLWSFVLSPLDGYRLPMEQYGKAFMAEVQADLGVQLDYLGAVHYDSAFPHIHFLVRGRDMSNQEYRLSKSYIKQGMRTRAQQIATRYIDLGLTHAPERDMGPTLAQARARAQARTQQKGQKVSPKDRVITLDEYVRWHSQQAVRDSDRGDNDAGR